MTTTQTAIPGVAFDLRRAFDRRFAELCEQHGLTMPPIELASDDRWSMVVLIGIGRDRRAAWIWKTGDGSTCADRAFEKWAGRR